MNLTWHIVRKDVRRMTIPVALWLALIAAMTAWFRFASPGERGGGSVEFDIWVRTMAIWTRLQVGGQIVIGYLLAGTLVLEDRLRGTSGFWMTRPITNARLFRAKLAAAALLFVAAPTGVVTTIWLASGFSLRDAGLAAVEFAFWQTLVTLAAVTTASLADSLASFLFRTVGLVGGLVVTLVGSWYLVPPPSFTRSAVYASRNVLMIAGVLAATAVVLTHQFLTRRTARTWRAIGLALAAGVAIRVAWPWDISSGIAARMEKWRLAEKPEDRTAEIATSSLSKWNRTSGDPSMIVFASWTKNGFYIPVSGALDDSGVGLILTGGRWDEAGERLLGFSSREGPLRWWLRFTSHLRGMEKWSLADAPRLTGKLEIWSARARVMGEMPLRVGGELSNGATRTRIVELRYDGERLDAIFVEEHDAMLMLVDDLNDLQAPTAEGRHFDYYLLIDRATRRVQSLWAKEIGVVRMNSLCVLVRSLSVGGSEAWRDAAVVKVRIERDHSFTRPFAVQGITFEEDRRRP